MLELNSAGAGLDITDVEFLPYLSVCHALLTQRHIHRTAGDDLHGLDPRKPHSWSDPSPHPPAPPQVLQASSLQSKQTQLILSCGQCVLQGIYIYILKILNSITSIYI